MFERREFEGKEKKRNKLEFKLGIYSFITCLNLYWLNKIFVPIKLFTNTFFFFLDNLQALCTAKHDKKDTSTCF